jgi:hypothetical protein
VAKFARVAYALASAMTLTACAAAVQDVKPKAGFGTVAQNPACLQTGSRIPDKGTNCSAFGRSYSRDDINVTGATEPAEALRLLDPSITAHH